MFEATEIAGYGFVINLTYLDRHGLTVPESWTDLADPRYAGHVTLPVPSRIGFAPTITEILLQSYGWEAGWALLARIAAHSALISGRNDDFLGAVTRGETGIGITIDFFAAQAIARGAPLRFIYPSANAFEPATIAIPKTAPHPQAALDYVTFVLSAPGQSLLIDRDVRRLAVRPDSYRDAPPDYFNPWDERVTASLRFDQTLFVCRRDIDNALFDSMITTPRAQTASLWAGIAQRRRAPLSLETAQRLDQAEQALTAVPSTEAEANRLAPIFAGGGRAGSPRTPEAVTAEARWTGIVAAHLDQAGAAVADALRA
jgi:spermidine/putrescine-binding protein